MRTKRVMALVAISFGLSTAGTASAADPLIQIPQGWNDDIRDRFWFTSQGSALVPYDWFLHLEVADGTERFSTRERMDDFRYITLSEGRNPASLNPDGLPIGFVRSSTNESWLGLTCAACHTNQLEVGGNRYIIEGAPTLANFARFFSELIAALGRTDEDAAKFARFADRVLGGGHSPDQTTQLHADLHELTGQLIDRQAANRPTTGAQPATYPLDNPGFGRLDAFGNIMNQISTKGLGDPNNRNPSNAPVSYPFLWGTPQSDVVQWNGSAPNTLLIGPLVRNVGEVSGVFGQVKIEPRRWWQLWKKLGYKSRVDMVQLGRLEGWLWDLRAPKWQDTSLPPLDTDLVATGSDLYQSAGCKGCHKLVPQAEKYSATMVPISVVGTDPNMDENLRSNRSKSLRLDGTRKNILFGERFDEEADSFEIVVNAVIGVLLRHPLEAIKGMRLGQGLSDAELDALDLGATDAVEEIEELLREQVDDLLDQSAGGRYKARPLTGIWATAPYLHNGSVPNLAALLTNPEDRPDDFFVGSRQYDPDRVGFQTNPEPNSTKFVASSDGNSNQGHAFGTDLSVGDKHALIEYLKSL